MRIVHVTSNLFEFDYASQIRVSIPCNDFVPLVGDIIMHKLDSAKMSFQDPFPALGDHLLRAAVKHVASSRSQTISQVWPSEHFFPLSTHFYFEIVRSLSDYWSSCSQIQSQIRFLHVKFPLEIIPGPQPGDFRVTATVLFPPVKAKALVSFNFTGKIVATWPANISQLTWDVEVVSGPIV